MLNLIVSFSLQTAKLIVVVFVLVQFLSLDYLYLISLSITNEQGEVTIGLLVTGFLAQPPGCKLAAHVNSRLRKN